MPTETDPAPHDPAAEALALVADNRRQLDAWAKLHREIACPIAPEWTGRESNTLEFQRLVREQAADHV